MKAYKSVFRIGLLASLILMIGPSFMKPDGRSYDELWKEVDTLIEKGLPRSALELIEVVHQKAVSENNGQQLLKSTIYRFSANQQFEEDHLIKAIAYAQTQLPLLKTPEKQILLSIQAELYLFYYQQNRYRLLERSTILGQRPTDIKEWDLDILREVIAENYELSLENMESLFKENLADYASILVLTDKESIAIQPTIYDFLAHRLLNYYLLADAGIKQPDPTVTFDDTWMFAATEEFVAASLPNHDEDVSKAFKLLQKLINYHFINQDSTALIYNEIKRLELAHQHYQGDGDKTQLYETALGQLLDRYQHTPASADIAFALASFLMSSDLAQVYHDDNESHTRFKMNEALQLCKKAIEMYPDSKGATNCKVLQAQILRHELAITIQRVYSPEEPIPALLKYRNLTKPAFRLIAVESETLEDIMGITNRDKQRAAMLALDPMKSWNLDLSFEEDYRSHSLVFDIPALSPGLYLLLAASSPKFSSEQIIEYASFQVSSLSFISSKRDGINHFYLLDRESGNPVRNANIKVMSREYDYTRRRYSVEQRMELSTARDGSFSFGAEDVLPSNRAFYVEAETKNDRLYSDNYFDVYKPRQTTRKQTRTWFFTDRAIYRPGQAIYFKGIVLERQGDDYSILSDQEHHVKFYDVNGQEIASLKLKTNEYGSFEGSFTAPLGALTGEMRITDGHGSVSVSVEEYKRPTFEVKLKMPEYQYRLNDSVELHGEALAYAGYPIDSVEFTFKVYREPFFPWRSYWIGIPPFGGEQQLIASGKSFTRKDGSFKFGFIARPDHSLDKRFDAAFNFRVVVDVTDRSGESRSGSHTINVGMKALILRTDMPETVENTKITNYELRATNLQGEAVETEVAVSVYRINKAVRLIRPSLWPVPDRHLLDKSSFEQLFPLDAWDDGEALTNRDRELVFTTEIPVDGNATFLPNDAISWPDGEYLIIAKANDVFGEEVELSQAFTLFNRETKTMPANTLKWFNISHNEANPGETVHFTFGTSAQNTRILIEVFSNDKLLQSQWLRLANEMSSLTFDVDTSHRGMLRFQATAVRYNRILSQSYLVKVPHLDKILDIELITKRDKLKPGAEETWELKISGHNKETVAAELLATMYDASLDQFKQNNWYFDLISYPAPPRTWSADNGFLTYRSNSLFRQPLPDRNMSFVRPPQLNWFGFYVGYGMPFTRQGGMLMYAKDETTSESVSEVMLMEVVNDSSEDSEERPVDPTTPEQEIPGDSQPSQRINFNETAFFFPQLYSDEDGSVRISFTLPDALTRWRLMLLAHTKELKSGMQEYSFTASKELMIVPNTTRFYREGDTAWVAAKVVNTGEQILTGIAWIEIFDAFTTENLPYIEGNLFQKPFVNLMPGRSQDVRWKIQPGDETNLMGLRFAASAEGFTDSEVQYIPILPRKVLVTETMPLYVHGEQTKKYSFESLMNLPEIKPLMMRIDFSSNPVWYAIQALPYLHDDGAENVHGIFNRYYANSLASHIANSIPGVMQVIDSWRTHQPDAFLSELEKNEDIKSVLLNETPWVMHARSESERKRNIVLLFDLNRMRYEQQHSINRLAAQQLPNGAWPWFKGMRENRFITQTVVSGLGRMEQLGLNPQEDPRIQTMINQAVRYLDEEVMADYERLKDVDKNKSFNISPLHLNYLYARSFYMDNEPSAELQQAIDYFLNQAVGGWLELNVGMQAMAAVVLNRFGKPDDAMDILTSLRERALHHEEFGTYWRQSPGYFWYQTPVENQVWLIEAFAELDGDEAEIDGLRTWLLAQKRTTHWNTGRATADAIYALLMHGTDWTSTKAAEIKVGGVDLPRESFQAGTGYFSHQWSGKQINHEMAEITITNPNKSMAWGGVYLQYFEDIDKVKGHSTPLMLKKALFVKSIANGSEVLLPIHSQPINIGDEVVVRVVLEVDRDMEYVHLKDERAAAFEPMDVLSGYNWRDGLGYYQSTRDASTNFFFAYLPKGTYVFEYSVRASHAGGFASGLAKIQCLYAPEFSSHSAGQRVVVVD